jgi:pyruvate-formate lyase
MTTNPTTLLPAGYSPRIARLRDASRARAGLPHADNARFGEQVHQAYVERFTELPPRKRQARAFAWALAHLPVYHFPEARLAGMVYHLGSWAEVADPYDWVTPAREQAATLAQDAELSEMKLYTSGGFPGHITWRWDWVLEKGILGMIEEYRTALLTAHDETARDFYEGVITRLVAVLHWNERHIIALEEALCGAPRDERARLTHLLDICRRVPASPARTFHEAVQSFYFQHLCVMRENPYGGNGPGRLDYFLWPYLERDLAAGAITLAEAYELVQELFIFIHERILEADGWVETIVVGGCHPDGSSAVNPLSHLMVEAIIALDQVHPAVYMRMPDNPPADYVALAARYLREGKNRAQILSDPAIMAAMMQHGMPAADAAHYTCGGCMEILPQGMQSDMLFTAYHNVPKVVEVTLTGGECLRTGGRLAAGGLRSLTAYADFEAFFAAFAAELRRQAATMVPRLDLYSRSMAEHRPQYLLSSLMQDCLVRGREQHDGGARYHDYGVAALGVPNAADALYAVKRAVFEDRLCTAEELLAALRVDFAGYETLQAALRAFPKYGQQHPDADAMADRVLTALCDAYDAAVNERGGRLKPMLFTFVWSPEAGGALGATAYGEHAGRNIAQGLTPQNSAMSDGITAAIGSHAGLSLHRVTGAATTMWDLDTQWASQEVVSALLTSFLDLGGMIFQGNTTDVADLIAARARPQDFPNLIVRVGGFSSRFVILSAELQEEIIARVRHQG